ncbi:hypothetical protein M758_11G036000 [Ceratodon purpureus]|nr:hypothetical protein M758_11G036000 [Ceratodon purpureus]
MGKPLMQDSYATAFPAPDLVRNALKELINALDLHKLEPKVTRPRSRKFKVAKPFLPPGISSKFTTTRPNQSHISKPPCSYSTTATSECREDLNLPVCDTTTNSPPIVDSSHIDSCSAGSGRRNLAGIERLQSKLVVPSLRNSKHQNTTSGGNSSPNSECSRSFSCQVNSPAANGVSSEATRPRSRA